MTERHRPQRGSDVEAWIKRYRETYRDSIGQTTGAWWAIDGLLDDYQDHADSSTQLDQIGRRQRIWDCKIGEVPDVGSGMDSPMRDAVIKAYREVTGEDPVFIFSGWGGELTEPERAVVEGREPWEAP